MSEIDWLLGRIAVPEDCLREWRRVADLIFQEMRALPAALQALEPLARRRDILALATFVRFGARHFQEPLHDRLLAMAEDMTSVAWKGEQAAPIL